MKIKLLNKIAKVGIDNLDKTKYEVSEFVENPDAIMVRSAAMHDMEFGKELKAIARAGAGVNNIPVDRCAKEGIVVFNTPGANANAVKELTLAGLLLASRDIVGGIEWVKGAKDDADIAKTAEKAKKNFAGTEISEDELIYLIGDTLENLYAQESSDASIDIVEPEINKEEIEQYLIDTRISTIALALLE